MIIACGEQGYRGERVKKIDGIMLRHFIDENFNSYREFSNEVGISYSHLYYIFNEKITVGEKTLSKINAVLNDFGDSIDKYIYPDPIVIKGMNVSQIDVFDGEELICSISSKDVICKDNIMVKCRPYWR